MDSQEIIIFILGFILGALTLFFYKRKNPLSMEELKGLSAEALKNNNEIFLQLAKSAFGSLQEGAKGELEKKEQAVVSLVKPVRETLEKFDQRLQQIESQRSASYLSLKEQVHILMEAQKVLHKETQNLVQALRAPAVRGRWGEIQLRRVVELAGMLSHCDFYEQASHTSEEGRMRPDLLVKLPGDKNILIDAKVPLQAYLEAIATEDEKAKQLKLKEHAKQIRNHMLLLSRKAYWEEFSPTPEFVVLFLPGESFFSSALEHDPSLIEGGVDQKVILATPTSLIALLRAVAYGWRQEKMSQNALQISSLGRELYKRLADFSTHLNKVGKSLGNAVNAYNKAMGSLESRVFVTARRFEELAGDNEIAPAEIVDQIPKPIHLEQPDNTP